MAKVKTKIIKITGWTGTKRFGRGEPWQVGLGTDYVLKYAS